MERSKPIFDWSDPEKYAILKLALNTLSSFDQNKDSSKSVYCASSISMFLIISTIIVYKILLLGTVYVPYNVTSIQPTYVTRSFMAEFLVMWCNFSTYPKPLASSKGIDVQKTMLIHPHQNSGFHFFAVEQGLWFLFFFLACVEI